MLKAETAFKYKYLDQFVGLYLFLEMMKKGLDEQVAATEFKAWYKDVVEKKGKAVLKFGEKFSTLPIPKQYAKEIAQVDTLVDRINNKIDELYKNETIKNIDELLNLIREVNTIIKSAKPTNK